MGGNIGRAVLTLDPPAADRFYVVECSSYQIDLAPSINPTAGILLNLTPDHLDRHGTMQHYAAIKERLVAGSDTAIIGVDDIYCAQIADRLERAGKHGRPHLQAPAADRRLFRRRHRPDGGRATARYEPHRLPRRHRLAARPAQCAERARRRRRLPDGRARPRRDPVRAAKAFRASRTAWSRSAARAACCSSTIPRRPMPMPRRRRCRAFRASTGSPAACPRKAASSRCAAIFPRIAKAYLIGEAAPAFSATLGEAVPYEISGTLDRGRRACGARCGAATAPARRSCCCRRPAPASTSSRISKCAAKPSGKLCMLSRASTPIGGAKP